MNKLFVMILLGTLSMAQAAEVSTDCPAMNQERNNPKADLQTVKVKRPAATGATKQ